MESERRWALGIGLRITEPSVQVEKQTSRRGGEAPDETTEYCRRRSF